MTTKTAKNYSPRLWDAFKTEGVKQLKKTLSKENVHEIPRLEKIVINIGVSQARENIKSLDIATNELTVITGQKPVVRKAKNSISAFKLREGMPIGVSVTLRSSRMYDFLDRFISVAIPRIRDFRGLNPHCFDRGGNYNLGLREQYIFPEINVEKSDAIRGMNITFVTTTKSDKEAFELLRILGLPFKKEN